MSTAAPAEIGQRLALLARPQNALYSVLLAMGCAIVAQASVMRVVTCGLAIGSLYACAAAYNNRQDIATDRINKRHDNPLLRGGISDRVLAIFLWANVLGLVILQFFLRQPASLAITVLYGVLLAAYSHPRLQLQARGWWATASLTCCYGAIPLALGLAQASVVRWHFVLLFAGLQLVLLAPISLAKDYKDEPGDRATGKNTPLVRYGAQTVRWVAVGCTILTGSAYLIIVRNLHGKWWLVYPTVALYASFCFYLHNKRGVASNLMRKSGSAIILFIGLYGAVLAIRQ